MFNKKKKVDERMIRYEALINSFKNNGFTEDQAEFLICLLDRYIPLI